MTAINPRPKQVVVDPRAALQQTLGQAGFAGEAQRQLAHYPPWMPWTSRPPSSGPRAGGRRTGDLGRGWRMFAARRERSVSAGQGGVSIIDGLAWGTENRVRYAVYVEGPRPGRRRRRQTAVMAARGWPSVTIVGRAVWRRYAPQVRRILKQSDARLVRRIAP